MGEKKGFLFTLFILGAFVLPFALDIWIANVRSDQFMKVATEMHQLVEQEGGATATVMEVRDKLAEGGLNVTFSHQGRQPVGTEVVIRYQYEYHGIIGTILKEYDTTNKVIVSRR